MISPSVTPLRHWDSNSKGIAMDIGHQMTRSQDVATKVAVLFKKRTQIAQEQFTEQLKKAYDADGIRAFVTNPAAGVKLWSDWYAYAADAAQRSILFWDTMRQRGNNFIERTRQGLPPVLHFDSETVVDGRKLARPVNYALVRIVPPEGITVDPKRRPYVIIDPRAGH